MLPSQYFSSVEKQILWCAYWVGLGILSSVGLGTGLHTFLLYLVSTTVCWGEEGGREGEGVGKEW